MKLLWQWQKRIPMLLSWWLKRHSQTKNKKLAINTSKNTAITKLNDVKSLTKEDVQRLIQKTKLKQVLL
jgi:hypothetical protein